MCKRRAWFFEAASGLRGETSAWNIAFEVSAAFENQHFYFFSQTAKLTHDISEGICSFL